MGFLDIIKILFLPALIAGSLYALFAYLIIPLARHHRERYNQYLPLNAISSTSSTLRDRLADFVLRLATRGQRRSGFTREDSDDNVFGDEEGESMVGFDVERRERGVRGGRVEVVGSDGRLSRELEEGFKDDSSSEEGGGEERGSRGRRRGRGSG